jgi:hypothetical protein
MEPHTKIKVEYKVCQKETLEALTWHTPNLGAGAAQWQKNRPPLESRRAKPMSEKCSKCGKSASEIKRAWEEGSAIDAEKRRKKLEELKKLGFSGIVRG